jgi:hypothetical protein
MFITINDISDNNFISAMYRLDNAKSIDTDTDIGH